jgi:activator of HSP90 ATPase
LSLGRIKEQSTIGGSSNVDMTLSKIILTSVMKLNDDQDEQDDRGLHYWSEVQMGEDYTEQFDISNDE